MGARFVALPVGQGDAFFLEREGLRVLVDGGKSREKAAALLAPLIPDGHLDIVICTHNDKDHAEGVRGLLTGERFSVGEVWLPGRWTDRLVDLCTHRERFVEELVGQVREQREPTPLSEIAPAREGKAVDAKTPGTPDAETPEAQRGSSTSGAGTLEDVIDGTTDDDDEWWWWPWRRGVEPNEQLWAECIEAAKRIRAIALAARNLGSRIRWFDFEEFVNGTPISGGRPDLLPVNAVEMRPKRRPPTALEFLSLSLSNRESLVFRSPPDADGAGVLFTADSDLAFDRRGLQPADGEIVTSPHHGSDANAGAYKTVDGLVSNATTLKWVRSDGRFQSRPGTSFKAKQAQAACTRCRGHSSAGQLVELTGTGGTWAFAASTRACHCI